MSNDSKDLTSKSWFCVFNNPEQHGYIGTPEEIIERLKDEWIVDNPTRTGAWLYCISASGLKHIHMVLEDTKTMRFSLIKKSYACGMHFEPTKGTKEQAEDYINKRGKFVEKGEKILASLRHGEIKGCQGKRRDLEIIQELLDKGLTPSEIMAESIHFRLNQKIIISAYRDKRKAEIPFVRDVMTTWHVGESGSGKSHVAKKLVSQYGEKSLFFMTSYENGCFDSYEYQPILFMDEYRGQFTYSRLLSILDKYKHEEHARYENITSAWTEVHITSVKTPDEIYTLNIQDIYERQVDTFEQLRRRINYIVYHWKDEIGFHEYKMSMSDYMNRTDLQMRAIQYEFQCLGSDIKTPFD